MKAGHCRLAKSEGESLDFGLQMERLHEVQGYFQGIPMVPGAGIEPARHCWHGILSPGCLPVSPSGQSARILAQAQRL